MGKTMTALQLAANKQNALKSTGPRTTEGRAIAKFNALKHGILSKQALIKGGDFSEKGRDLAVLHQRFRQDLKPVGVTEEMLVDQIVTATWRLQRAVRAESAGIALEADEQQERRESGVDEGLRDRLKRTNTFFGLNQTAGGTVELMYRLEDVMEMVEKEGELTEAAIKQLEARFDGKPNRLTREVDERRLKLAANPDGLDPRAFKEYKKKEALDYLERKIANLDSQFETLSARETQEKENRQAAAALPSKGMLDRLLRYESKLEKQIRAAMEQLERLQRVRNEAVREPLTVEVHAETKPAGLLNEPITTKNKNSVQHS